MIDLRDVALHSGASQDKFELWRMLEVLAARPPKVIVEIGVHKGYLMETFNEAFKPEILLGIDNDPMVEDVRIRQAVITGDSTQPETHLELRRRLVGRSIDFLFIDGDHTYGGVKRDWEHYSPLVRRGGVVGFHDTRRIGDKWKNHVEVYPIFRQLQTEYPSAEFWNGALGEGAPGTGLIFV